MSGKTPDTYVTLRVGTNFRHTKTCPKNINPNWNEAIQIEAMQTSVVEITVFEKGFLSDSFVGFTAISLQDPNAWSPGGAWYALGPEPKRTQKVQGGVLVQLAWAQPPAQNVVYMSAPPGFQQPQVVGQQVGGQQQIIYASPPPQVVYQQPPQQGQGGVVYQQPPPQQGQGGVVFQQQPQQQGQGVVFQQPPQQQGQQPVVFQPPPQQQGLGSGGYPQQQPQIIYGPPPPGYTQHGPQ